MKKARGGEHIKNEADYKKHVEASWKYAQSTVENIADEQLRKDLALIVFDKYCSPYHYFLQNENQDASEKATEKQIGYAKQLGIKEPEQYSKSELSEKINEAKNKK